MSLLRNLLINPIKYFLKCALNILLVDPVCLFAKKNILRIALYVFRALCFPGPNSTPIVFLGADSISSCKCGPDKTIEGSVIIRALIVQNKEEPSICRKTRSKHRQVISSNYPKNFRGARDLVVFYKFSCNSKRHQVTSTP